jgi:3-dehydroquinate synthetase
MGKILKESLNFPDAKIVFESQENQIIVSSRTKEAIQNQFFSTKTILIKPGEEIKGFEYIHECY